MPVDEVFLEAGKSEGYEIWRIEKMNVVLQSASSHGDFYSGDSYIVLSTTIKPGTNKLHWDIHFWLGKDTSQDEQGVAAYKTVELDDHLGGGPVQHREVQDHESQLFVSYFKKGVRYLEGGVASGFRKVEKGVYEKRLLHIKGKRNVRVRQVECHCKSLNQGDVFILDCGMNIYIWNGPNSSRMERMKGAEVTMRIRNEERGGNAKVYIVDDARWDSDMEFYKALGSKESIKSADAGGDDAQFERVSQANVALFRVSDAKGKLEITEVSQKPLKQDHLDSNDCFILDSGPSGIYVWIGKKCTKNEKKSAWQHATTFLTQRGLPQWTPITQVVEMGETPLFKQYFSTWKDPNAQTGMGSQHRTENIAKVNMNEKFDVGSLHGKSQQQEESLVDDGKGEVKVWRIENYDMVPVPEKKFGMFYTGDCYVLMYTYQQNKRDHYIVYFWQGTKSTTDEKGSSAIFAQRLDDEQLHGQAVQIRVVQGREPEHFLRLFKGQMVILLGGINNQLVETSTTLYHIRGTNNVNTRAMQVPPRAASLNSNDVFVAINASSTIMWQGKGSSAEEKSVAQNICKHLSSSPPRMVDEDSEPEDFWVMLGGKEAYATGKRLEDLAQYIPPRLFQCSNATGRFRVEEIVNFSQEDLDEDDVMLLDTFEQIAVWIGKGANAFEKKEALKSALEYIRTDPAGRSPENTDIIQVKQGFEPTTFTGYFHGWDPDRWSQGKSYDDLKRELGVDNAGVTLVETELEKYNKTYTLKELQRKIPPEGVDVTCKQSFLSDADFKTAFGITKAEFDSKPAWRKTQLKKDAGLF